jgi:hypothetical protein
MRQMSVPIAVTLAAIFVAWPPIAGEAAARKWHGARSPHTTFHGAEVYLPGYTYAGPTAPPIFNDGGAYCWHWFRNGRGWATTWWC